MCKLLRHERRYAEAIKLMKSLPEDIRENAELKMFNEGVKFNAERSDDQASGQLVELMKNNEADIELKKQLIIQYAIEEKYELALLQLVEMMEQDHSYENNYAQSAMLRVFTLLGDSYPLISKFRSNLRRYTH